MAERPANELLVGIDLGGTKLAIALANPDGTLVTQNELPTLAEQGAEQALDRALTGVHSLLADRRASALAVGISTMGITYDDRVELAPNVPGWSELQLPRVVRRSFPATAFRVDNDVKAAAFAELTRGALRGVDTGVYLNLGTGIAAALIVGGRVVRGAHGAAGEIGYWVRSRDHVAGALEGRAPLEETVGGVSTTAQARAQFGASRGVAELVGRDDPPATDFLTELYDEIGLQVANLATLLDPDRVVVGGGYVRTTPDRLLAAVRQRLDRYVPYPPELLVAHFRADAGVRGALALAQDAVVSAKADSS